MVFGDEFARPRRELARAIEPPLRRSVERRFETCQRGRRKPAEVEARRTLLRNESAFVFERAMGEGRRQRDPQTLGIANVETAGRLGTAEPLLAGHGVVVELAHVGRYRTDRLRTVDEDRQTRFALQLVHRHHLPGRPDHVGQREQSRPWCDRCQQHLERLRRRPRRDLRDDNPRFRSVKRKEQARMLGVRRHDLVAPAHAESGEDDVAAVRRRAREREVRRRRTDCSRDFLPHAFAQREHALDPRLSAASELVIEPVAFGHRRDRRARERPQSPRVQIREAFKDGKLRTHLGPRHVSSRSTGG